MPRRAGLLILLFSIPFLASCATTTFSGNLHVRQLFTEGLAYESLSNYSAALDRYERVLENFDGDGPWSQRARLRMARVHNNHLNQPDEAIERYRAFLDGPVESDETRASVLMELARIYRNQNRTEKAIETYRMVTQNYSSISQVEESYYNLGEIYLEQERYEETIGAFRSLLEEFPEGDLRDGALFQLAKAYDGLGKSGKQLEAYVRLLENHPESDLYEYTLYLTVQLAAASDRRDVALKWARTYRDKYDNGDYFDEIRTVVESKWSIDLRSETGN